MNIKDYSEKMMQTAVYPRELKHNYPFKGLVDEFGEVLEILWYNVDGSLEKEIGDVYWYGNALSKELNFDFVEIATTVLPYKLSTFEAILRDMILSLAKMSGHLKKYERDNNMDKLESFKLEMKDFFYLMTLVIKNRTTVTMEDILQLNHDKLFSRKERNVIHGDGDNR